MLAKQPLIGFTALDGTDSSAVARFWIHRGTEVSAAMSAAAAMRGRLVPLSSCAFIRQSVVYPFIEMAPAAPLAGAQATRVGVFVFATSEPDRYAIVEIPGILDAMLLTSGPGAGVQIDPAAPAVVNLVAELTSGRWCNPFGQVLIDLVAAFVQVRP